MAETQIHCQKPTGALEIRFPAYTSGAPPRCTPRTNLAGVVYLQLPKARAASSLILSFVGSECISLAPASVNSSSNNNSSSAAHVPAVRSRTMRKEYFRQTVVLWSGKEVGAGIHMFHFSCEFPRVNYPQSSTTDEYQIAYVFTADLARDDAQAPLLSASQTINFVPETVAPLAEPSHMMRYQFSDSVQDAEDPNQQVFGLQVLGLQQAFVPGDTVDFQVRVAGQRSLRRAQFVLYEQTDCFYPQIPAPHEEQLDLGRRLWTARKALGEKRDLPFERDAAHDERKGGAIAYCAHLHARLPASLFVLHQSAYLRTTYYVELTLFSTAGWSGHVRRAQARVPVPVASRVLPEQQQPRALPMQPPSVHSRRSSASAQTDVECPPPPMRDRAAQATADPSSSSSSRLNRSITDLGARLQQFIPRRLPSVAAAVSPLDYWGHRSRRSDAARNSPYRAYAMDDPLLLAKPSLLRAASHCTRITDQTASPQWLLSPVGSPQPPPVPPLPGRATAKPSVLKQSAVAIPLASPLSSTASLVTVHSSMASNSIMQTTAAMMPGVDHGSEPHHTMPPSSVMAPRNQQLGRFFHASALQAMSTNGYKGGFSTTFLTRLHDMYHVDAHRKALAQLLLLGDSTEHSVVPSAMIPAQEPSRTAGGLACSNRDRALGLFDSQHQQQKKTKKSRRLSRLRAEPQGTTLVDQRLWPRLGLVMTTYRNPWSSQISTWSAAGSCTSLAATAPVPRQPHQTAAVPSADLRLSLVRTSTATADLCVGSPEDLASSRSSKQHARCSRISALSVSSNDTACVSNGRLSLAKDPVTLSADSSHHHAMILNDLVVSLDTVL
ncbi:hypothetical protein EV175_002910 [Coemansia sp. RSA 1933]|nr:hypothetical protein EV175_002910 [Coemansia sp. RSA 1933]